MDHSISHLRPTSLLALSRVCVFYIRSRRSLSGTDRTHIKHLLFAVLSAAVGATTTNLFLPLMLGTSRYGQYGSLFTLLLIGLVGHAIIRHRLMDIRIVIKRGAVYIAAFLTAGAVLFILLVTLEVHSPGETRSSTFAILVALAVAALFHPIKTRIQREFDRYLYREPYNYQEIVRDTSRLLGGTIELGDILGHMANAILNTLKPSRMAIYLFEEDQGHFVLAWRSGMEEIHECVSISPVSIAAMASTHSPIIRDELSDGVPTQHEQELLHDLDSLGVHVIAPLIEDGRVIGLLALGAKPFDNPYFSDDVDLLATLANQSSVAIRNAQTHQRVVQLNDELQTIIGTIESGVVAVGANSRITLFNRASEQLIGVPAATARGQLVHCLPSLLAKLIEATSADGEPRSNVEFSLPDASGQLVPLVCSTMPLLSPHGTPSRRSRRRQ